MTTPQTPPIASSGEAGAPVLDNSIYAIARKSPSVTWAERAQVSEDAVEAALGASVPGGSSVYAWLPMQDGHTIHPTARDVMRSALAGAAAVATPLTPPAASSGQDLREPDHIHEQHGTDCGCPKCWPAGYGPLGGLEDEIWSVINRKDDETDKETTRKIMEAVRAALLSAPAVQPGGDLVVVPRAVLRSFEREAVQRGLTPDRDRYSFANTGLSNGDIRVLAMLAAVEVGHG